MLIVSFPFRRAFKRQCTEDGSWLEGACEPVTCDPPPPIFHGSYHCTDGFRFDSICRLNCSDPAGNTANAATGGSAHTVRLLHAPCKQVCPSLSSLSILALPICLSSFCHVYEKSTFSLFLPSLYPYRLSLFFGFTWLEVVNNIIKANTVWSIRSTCILGYLAPSLLPIFYCRHTLTYI